MNDLSDNPKEDGYNIVRLFLQYHPNTEADIQSKTKKLANILGKIPEFRELDNRDAMMKNPVIHDFVTLLFVYNDVMKVSATKKARNRKMEEICHLFCDEDGRIKILSIQIFCSRWLTRVLGKSRIPFIEQKSLEVFTMAVRALN